MRGCLTTLGVIALIVVPLFFVMRACNLQGIGHDTPEGAVKGFYEGLAKSAVNSEEYIHPEIRDTDIGRAILDLYDPKQLQFSGQFRLYGHRRAQKMGTVTLETMDTINSSETSATIHVSGTFGLYTDLSTVMLKFGPYSIDDTVYLVRKEGEWFIREIKVHSDWSK